MTHLQAQCDDQATRWQALAADAAPSAAGASQPVGGGAASSASARVQTAPMDPAKPSPWGRSLLAQLSGTALGVTMGLVAGGLLLQGLQGLWGADAASPDLVQGSDVGFSNA